MATSASSQGQVRVLLSTKQSDLSLPNGIGPILISTGEHDIL